MSSRRDIKHRNLQKKQYLEILFLFVDSSSTLKDEESVQGSPLSQYIPVCGMCSPAFRDIHIVFWHQTYSKGPLGQCPVLDRNRCALQQLALNVHVKHADLTRQRETKPATATTWATLSE